MALELTDESSVFLSTLPAGRHQRRLALALVLACGYLFTAFVAVAHALTFPGLFSVTGLLGAGSQSTAWLRMFWLGGFPLCVIAYALVKDESKDEGGRAEPHRGAHSWKRPEKPAAMPS